MRSALSAAAVVLACAVFPAAGQPASPEPERPAPPSPGSTVTVSPRVSDQPSDPKLVWRSETEGGEDAAAEQAAPEESTTSLPPGMSFTTIPLGEPATIAVISPDEHWAYAFAQAESTLFVIDLRKHVIAKRFTFNYALWSLAISQDGSRLFLSGTQPRGSSHDACVFIVVNTFTKTSLLTVDAQSGAVIGETPLSGVSFHAVLSPNGKQVVAVSSNALDVIDAASHTVSRHLAVPSGFHPYSAVFAAGGKKLFASAPAIGLAVFDLATGHSHLLAPPAGYTFQGVHTSAVPASDRVFTTVLDANRRSALAVIEGVTEKISVVPAATGGGFGGVQYSPKLSRLFLPGSGLVLDAKSLQPVGELPDEELFRFTGVAGQLSPDEATFYFRPFGAPEDSLTLWGDPTRYDLAIVDALTLQERAHFSLQIKKISCSDPSPLLIGKTGRTLVALNPALKSVSIIKVSQ